MQITHGEPVRTNSPPNKADGADGSPTISVKARSVQSKSVVEGALSVDRPPCEGDDDEDSVGEANSPVTV